ncbi:hypothetical protein HDU98_006104 [Podochytrium sp. JEL0797]|nr:hypothetical protein HDU98_006104 [Podochytrium sp. JEL0797]
MLTALRLDVDPDVEPRLVPENLSKVDKEERRRSFWVITVILTITNLFKGRFISAHSTTPHPILLQIGASRHIAPIVHLYHLLAIDSAILQHVTTLEPKSFGDIISSENFSHFRLQLSNHSTGLHPFLQLALQDPPPDTSSCLILLILFHKSTLCHLHRPHLFCTSHLEFQTPHQNHVAFNMTSYFQILSDSLLASFQNASQIAQIAARLPIDRHPLFFHPEQYFFAYIPLFEAAVVLWFICCRTNTSWMDFLRSRAGGSGDPDSDTTESEKEGGSGWEKWGERRTVGGYPYETKKCEFYESLKAAVSDISKVLVSYEKKMEEQTRCGWEKAGGHHYDAGHEDGRGFGFKPERKDSGVSSLDAPGNAFSFFADEGECWRKGRGHMDLDTSTPLPPPTNIFTPLVKCIDAMLCEMDAAMSKWVVGNNTGGSRSCGRDQLYSRTVVLEMEPRNEPHQQFEGQVTLPLVFLGLLGEHVVANGVRYVFGDGDKSWTLFWDSARSRQL